MDHACSKRRFLGQIAALAGMTAAGSIANDTHPWDVIVVGAGTAGMPLAIFASRRGARVLLIDAASRIGGTLWLSSGQMSAAGTRLQQSLGIEDSPQEHYDDVMRISRGTANPEILRLAVQNAARAADWLMDHGFEIRPGHPVLSGGHDPYSKRRYFWGMRGGLSVLDILERQLQQEIECGNVTLLLDTEVTALMQHRPGGEVTGVFAAPAGGHPRAYAGRSVVLTCGGYISNAAMFEQLEGVRDYGNTVNAFSRGAGISMGVAAGGYVRGQECHQPLFNAVLASDTVPSPLLLHLLTDPVYRPAWEIWVNIRGERFVAEDTPSFDDKEKALARQPEERCWVILDDAILQAAPSLSREWSKSDIIAAFGVYPLFYKAAALEDLRLQSGAGRRHGRPGPDSHAAAHRAAAVLCRAHAGLLSARYRGTGGGFPAAGHHAKCASDSESLRGGGIAGDGGATGKILLRRHVGHAGAGLRTAARGNPAAHRPRLNRRCDWTGSS